MSSTITIKNKSYTIQKILGKGSYGKVYLVTDSNGQQYALKESLIKGSDVAVSLNEIKILMDLKWNDKNCHPGVVCIYDYDYIQKNDTLFVLMEYVDGTELLNIRTLFGDDFIHHCIPIFMNGLSYLKYIHSKGYIHRDIKPENIMLTKKGDMKFIDFGLSCYFPKGDCVGSYNEVGTLVYNALDDNLCFGSDVFSFAIGIYEVFVTPYIIRHNQTPKFIYRIDNIYKTYFKKTLSQTRSIDQIRPKDKQVIVKEYIMLGDIIQQWQAYIGMDKLVSILLHNLLHYDYSLRYSAEECVKIVDHYLTTRRIELSQPQDNFRVCQPKQRQQKKVTFSSPIDDRMSVDYSSGDDMSVDSQ